MINCNNFMDVLRQSDFVRSQLPMQAQLGIPQIVKRQKGVRLVFYPHTEMFRDGKIEIYDKQFELEVAYPSCRVVKFADLTEDNDVSVGPVKVIGADWMMGEGKYIIDNIFDLCTETLRFYDEYQTVPDIALKKYDTEFTKAVEALGISCLYEVVK